MQTEKERFKMEKRSSLLDDLQAKNAVSMEIKVIKCKIFEKYTNISKVNS